MNQLSTRWAVPAVVVGAVVLGPGTAAAQLFPTTTTTTAPDSTTSSSTTTSTTSLLETTTTTSTTLPAETTTTATVPEDTTTTTGPPRTTTTATTTTTPGFVPPQGVTSTSAPAALAEEILEADTGKLPLFVALSLLGFAIAIAIVTVQWVRSRPGAAA